LLHIIIELVSILKIDKKNPKENHIHITYFLKVDFFAFHNCAFFQIYNEFRLLLRENEQTLRKIFYNVDGKYMNTERENLWVDTFLSKPVFTVKGIASYPDLPTSIIFLCSHTNNRHSQYIHLVFMLYVYTRWVTKKEHCVMMIKLLIQWGIFKIQSLPTTSSNTVVFDPL